jgi:hypothetical protein
VIFLKIKAMGILSREQSVSALLSTRTSLTFKKISALLVIIDLGHIIFLVPTALNDKAPL